MRVGLLTRFVGVLGAIVGVLLVLGPADGLDLHRHRPSGWLMAGALILGRWPSGDAAGVDRRRGPPWPSQQEIREQRERMRAERGRGRGAAGAPATAPSAPAATAARRAGDLRAQEAQAPLLSDAPARRHPADNRGPALRRAGNPGGQRPGRGARLHPWVVARCARGGISDGSIGSHRAERFARQDPTGGRDAADARDVTFVPTPVADPGRSASRPSR